MLSMDMCSIKRLIIFIVFLEYSISQSSSNNRDTLTNAYGRISNINSEHMYVSASFSLMDCIRQCANFPIKHPEYTFEDCFAYNYNLENYSCELIHSTEPLTYTISFQTKWMTGFKS